VSREVVYSDLAFGESPRWHDGRLWLSDIFGRRVVAVDMNGSAEEVCQVDNHPSGLGWLPDGRLLVVSMLDRKVLRLDPEGLRRSPLRRECPDAHGDRLGRPD